MLIMEPARLAVGAVALGLLVPARPIRVRDLLGSTVTWAVAVGHLAGKLIGISLATLLALRTGVGLLPDGMRLRDLPGVAALGGIGFTVSLFVSELAFADPAVTDTAKVGIFIGSIAAGLLGTSLLLLARRGRAGASEGAER